MVRLVRLTAVLALLGGGLASVAIPAAAASAPRGSTLWTRKYQGTIGTSSAAAVAVSPNGSRVYVTGSADAKPGSSDYHTIAYDAATGAQLWSVSYSAPTGDSAAEAIAVSPDGSRVFVTGASRVARRRFAYATVAYRASTGARIWAARYQGPREVSIPLSIAVHGSEVFVTGESRNHRASIWNFATVAYHARTGTQAWAAVYSQGGFDVTGSMAVSGSEVFVTGYSESTNSPASHGTTVAYSAKTGAQLWVKRLPKQSLADAVGVSPDGRTAYVFGGVTGSGNISRFLTVAYNATTGAQRWSATYKGPPGNGTELLDQYLAVSPDGKEVVTTGTVVESGPDDNSAYATVAYKATTGAQLWARLYKGGLDENSPAAIAVSPASRAVYVTGASQVATTNESDYATVAYSAATGSRKWVRDYGAPHHGSMPMAIAASRSAVFVTGSSPWLHHEQWATVGYSR